MPVVEKSYSMPTEKSSGDLKAKSYGASKDSGVPIEHRRWTDRLASELGLAKPEVRGLIVEEMARLKKSEPQAFESFANSMLDFCSKPKNNTSNIVEEALKLMNLKK